MSLFENPFGHHHPATIEEIRNLLNSIMSDTSKLTAATAALDASVKDAAAKLQALSAPSVDQPAIDAATASVEASTATLNAATAAATPPTA